ncbi:MAG: tetratricopeptide repeat protein [Verrucomicrobiae bacterium]|nr:tetratricopeptide repeat protein [Verrucomicrobiae bacterium]
MKQRRKSLWVALALLSVAATPEEIRMFRAGEAAFADRLYDVAERQLAEFLHKYPNSTRADRAHLLLGRAQLELGKWRAAVEALSAALKRWPDRMPDALRFWLAEAWTRGGKYAEAEPLYREVVEKFPQSEYRAAAWYGLAFAQFKLGRFDVARGTLEQFAQNAAGSGGKIRVSAEAELLQGQVELARGQLDSAEGMFRVLIERAPDSRVAFEARRWLAESLARRGQFDAAAVELGAITAAYSAKPNQPVEPGLAAEAWYQLGWVRWQQQQFEASAAAFLQALNLAGGTGLRRNALLKLGEACARAGKIAEAVARMREFLKNYPQDELAEQVQVTIADLLYSQQDWHAALAEYAQFVAQHPKSPHRARACANAGWCAWRTGQLAEAAKFFEQAAGLLKDPAAAAEALFKLADIQFALGQFTNAVTSYRRLLENHPAAPSLDRAFFQLGQAQLRIGDRRGASASFAELVRRFPNSPLAPEAQFLVGQTAVMLGQEEAARAAFSATVTNYQGTSWGKDAALAIGESYERQENYNMALSSYGALIANGPGTEWAQRALYRRGYCLARIGQAEQTLKEFTEFLAKHPSARLAPEMQFWVASYHLEKKDYLKAQEQFQALARNYPGSPLADAAQYYAGRTAYLRQDYKGAIELFEGVLKMFSNSVWCADARFGQGDALSELGQFADALTVFENLTKQFPNHPLAVEAEGRKGDCLFTLGRYEEAVASYRKALDGARDAATRNQALFKLGQCYEKLARPDEAVQFYARALYETATSPATNEPPERFWTAKAARAAAALKEQQQQWRDAITIYQRLAEVCPELKPLAEDRIRRIRLEHVILF